MKKVKIFNGRWKISADGKRHNARAYVGAHSKKHAVELCIKAGHTYMTINELNVYWSKNCWGDLMKGIDPQIGVWVSESYNDKVKRIL